MPAPGPPDVEPAIADMGADVDVVGVVIVDGGMTGGVVEGKMTAGPREPRTASPNSVAGGTSFCLPLPLTLPLPLRFTFPPPRLRLVGAGVGRGVGRNVNNGVGPSVG